MKAAIGSVTIVVLAFITTAACTGCGVCPLVFLDANTDGVLSLAEINTDPDLFNDLRLMSMADPLSLFLCASYLQSVQGIP